MKKFTLFIIISFLAFNLIAKESVDSKEAIAKHLNLLFPIFKKMLAPNKTTYELENYIDKWTTAQNFNSSFKGYHGYPYHVMASVDKELTNTFPNKKTLKDGSFVTIQFGLRSSNHNIYQAWSFPVGNLTKKQGLFFKSGMIALEDSIKVIRHGVKTSAVSRIIQNSIEKNGYSVIRDYTGHEFGEGMLIHSDVQITSFVNPNQNSVFEAGKYYSIMVLYTSGKSKLKISKDGWNAYTADGEPSLVFSHIVKVTKTGHVVLSRNYHEDEYFH